MPPRNHKNNTTTNSAELAAWLAEGLQAEAEGRALTYDLRAGRLVERLGPSALMYEFILAGGGRVIEDLPGILTAGSRDLDAVIRRRRAGLVFVEIEGGLLSGEDILEARLSLDYGSEQKSVAENLRRAAETPDVLGPRAAEIFYPPDPGQERDRAGEPDWDSAVGSMAEDAVRAELVYMGVPPGGDWATEAARIINRLVADGERVLVTAGTNEGLDQVLAGVLDQDWEAGRPLLKLGWSPADQAPREILWGRVRENRIRERREAEARQRSRLNELEEQQGRLIRVRDKRVELESQEDRLERLKAENRKAAEDLDRQLRLVDEVESVWRESEAAVLKVERSWLTRESKRKRTIMAYREATTNLRQAEGEAGRLRRSLDETEDQIFGIEDGLTGLQEACRELPGLDELRRQIESINRDMNSLEASLAEMAAGSEDFMSPGEARVVLGTYMEVFRGEALESWDFDTVVAAEASSAAMGLVFLAAARARKRVVLIGDFLRFHFRVPTGRRDGGVGRLALPPELLKALEADSGGRVLCRFLGHEDRRPPEISGLVRELAFEKVGFDWQERGDAVQRSVPDWLGLNPGQRLIRADAAGFPSWCGRERETMSRFNLSFAVQAVILAASLAARFHDTGQRGQPILIVTPYQAQAALLGDLILDLGIEDRVWAGTPESSEGAEADLVIFDSVLEEPHTSVRLTSPDWGDELRSRLAGAAAAAREAFLFLGSSAWLDKRAKENSALGSLWEMMKERAAVWEPIQQTEETLWQRPADPSLLRPVLERDLNEAAGSILAVLPLPEGAWWPALETILARALGRGVGVTFLTGNPARSEDPAEADRALTALRHQGAVAAPTTGMDGIEMVIDGKVVYLGCPILPGDGPVLRLATPRAARRYLELMQADLIGRAMGSRHGLLRSCPQCGWPVQVINQSGGQGPQPLKAGCTNGRCRKYLRNLDERPPYSEPPRCARDNRTPYVRVKRGRAQVWACPNHPDECPREKVVPGDPV